MITKINAKELSEADLKKLVTGTKDALTNNQKGILGEAISEAVYKNNPVKVGFEQVASKLPSNHGIDGLYFKYAKDAKGNYLLDASKNKIIEAIDIVEAKYGTSTLSYVKSGFKQMDNDWLRYTAERMIKDSDVAVQNAGEILLETLDYSPEKITKYLDNIEKESGKIVTDVLNSAGNKIN